MSCVVWTQLQTESIYSNYIDEMGFQKYSSLPAGTDSPSMVSSQNTEREALDKKVHDIPALGPSISRSMLGKADFSYIWMIVWFSLGFICCILHYVFNKSRRGLVVDENFPSLRHQQIVSVTGTAFAFIVKALYALALDAAYQQVVWRVWSKRPFSVEEMNNAIMLPADPRKFLCLELLKHAKRSICIGLIIWFASWATIFTPGTISVEPKPASTLRTEPVPTLDFLAVANRSPYGYKQLFSVGSAASISMAYSAPTDELEKLLTLTSYGGFVIPGPGSPCGQNCSYTITFSGPAQKCGYIGNYTLDENSPWRLQPNESGSSNSTVPRNRVYGNSINTISQIYYYDTALGQSIKNRTQAQDLWISWASHDYPEDGLPGLDTFEIPKSPKWELRTIRCVDYNATYTVNVSYIGGVERLTTLLTYLHPTNYTDTSGASMLDVHYSNEAHVDRNGIYLHRAVKTALIQLLQGTLGMVGGASTRSFVIGSLISNTHLVRPYTVPAGSRVPGLQGTAYMPIPDLRHGIEELAVNLTLTLLGTPDLVYRDPKGAVVPVQRTLVRNVYKYEPRNLILAYAILTVLTALAVLTGLAAAMGNGFWGDTTFASMYMMTNREHRDQVNIEGGSLDGMLRRRLRAVVSGDGNPVLTDEYVQIR